MWAIDNVKKFLEAFFCFQIVLIIKSAFNLNPRERFDFITCLRKNCKLARKQASMSARVFLKMTDSFTTDWPTRSLLFKSLSLLELTSWTTAFYARFTIFNSTHSVFGNFENKMVWPMNVSELWWLFQLTIKKKNES